MLGEIISQVLLATAPIYIELSLLHSIYQPIEAHANSFASVLLEDTVDNSTGSVVISLHRGGRLWVS